MALTQVVRYTVVGDTALDIPEAAFTTPLKVKRAGISYDIIYSGTPGNRQVLFTNSTGFFTFAIPFVEADSDVLIRNLGEPIYVLYKS